MYSSLILKQRYIVLQSLSQVELLSITYSLGASLCSHRVIHIKGSHEEVPYSVHNPITFTIPKRSPRAAFQWRRGQIIDFPKDDVMSFQQTNSKFIIYTKRIPLRLSTSSIIILQVGLTFHIKEASYYHPKSHVINTYGTKRIYHPKSRHVIFSFIPV